MALKQYLNGVLCDMPASQEADLIAFKKEETDKKSKRIKETSTAKTDKTSALTKLKALGLTEAEISAMFAEQTYREDE